MSRKRSHRSDSSRNDSRGDKYRSSRSSIRDQAASSTWPVLRIAIPIVALAACGAAAFIMSRDEPASKPGGAPSQPAQAPQSVTTAGGPRWVCDQPLIDFGQVWEGVLVQKDFTFRNTGDQVLKIEKPKPHCNCSSAPNYTKEVPPGGSGVIPFVLQTVNKPHGPLEEYLNIETNDPRARTVQVRLKGFIKNVLEPEVAYDATYEEDKAAGLNPAPVLKMKGAFGRIKGDRTLHRIVRLRNTSGQPLTLSMLAPQPQPPFMAELAEKVAGEEFELTIKANPPIPVGHTSTSVVLQTNVPERPRYQLWISSYVAPRIEVSPPEKMLIDTENFPQKEREIRIANNGQTPVDVVGISTSEPRFGITLKPRDPKLMNQQVIKIALPGGESYRPPPYGELIEITTNDPEVSLIRVAVVPTLNPTPRPPDKPLEMHKVPLNPDGN